VGEDVYVSDYGVLTVTAKDTEGLYQERSAREFSVWVLLLLVLLLLLSSSLVSASIFIVSYLLKH